MHYLLVALAITSSLFLTGCAVKRQPAQILLRSSPWHFSQGSALSTLSAEKPAGTFKAPSDSSSFTIKMKVTFKSDIISRTLLDIPGVLNVKTFQHDVKDRKRQNYPVFSRPDGSVPVLEAALRLHSPTEPKGPQDMPIGIPLAMLEKFEGEHEIILHFSGVRWALYVDNELLDNDFPLGYPKWGKQSSWKIDPEIVSKAEIFFPGIEPQQIVLKKPRVSNEIQYWTPQGHNTWVGDVATFYHQGRYHLFYLFDRRGHASKFGKGAHYFEHISTTDFKTWTEHEAATPIEEQWETFGTGTPFIFNNKLSLSYGLHTTRIYPKEQTSLPLQWDFYDKHGVTGSFRYDTIPRYPAGSTYSVSEDGISHFKKTKILFHPCENPSVYTDPEGRLRMLANYGAKGTWESKSINGGWKSVNPNFPPGGDCTFFFRWGNYDYVIGGFTGFWSKPASADEDQFVDGVKAGLDFYNGMNVPAVTEIKDGRFLLAGWIPMAGWGGALTIHEMIQFPDGRIGTKWMEEIIPATEKERLLAKEIYETSAFATGAPSFLLTFDVEPGTDLTGKIGPLLLGADGENHACEVQIRPKAGKAQYGKGQLQNFANVEKSLREGGSPSGARNYAIENLTNTDKPFLVRMIVKYDAKFGGSLIDTEIAGQRTMIAFRPELKVEKILLRSEGTGIENIRIAALKY
ncbi:Sucrose-6-phosphate hydrolase SacC, GH32 family [Dyadobacter psychrophilus]|uniref:Sucrose-6-phosphate hydrolase SacC, GH32 family n=2 Tax=Dyadobacter psychrophilus TaxID=651661 RepID=A0A1T5HIU7_9BACT|nr:Sucrose-6-phosphate hydrolase SacC, GH32 family [Dyadobacter psychrophilus]